MCKRQEGWVVQPHLPGPPLLPSNTGSTSTTGTAMRVPGDWSLR